MTVELGGKSGLQSLEVSKQQEFLCFYRILGLATRFTKAGHQVLIQSHFQSSLCLHSLFL
jgi:hypothetical protein